MMRSKDDLEKIFNILKTEFTEEYNSLVKFSFIKQTKVINSIFNTDFSYKEVRNFLKRKEKITKNCELCKKKFQTGLKEKIFCTEKCRRSAYKSRLWQKIKAENTISKSCKACKKKFQTSKSYQIYCSSCKNIVDTETIKRWQEENVEQYKDRKKVYTNKLSTKIKKRKDFFDTNSKTKEESIKSGNYKAKWDLQEDKFLLENWDKMTKKDIAFALSRTYASVMCRYRKIKS